MAVLRVVRAELARGGAAAELVGQVDAILENEVEVAVKAYEEEGAKMRRTRRSESQEALRAEIAKDAGALVALTDIHPAPAERRVPPNRLEALRDEAEKLSGLLGTRASAKGAVLLVSRQAGARAAATAASGPVGSREAAGAGRERLVRG